MAVIICGAAARRREVSTEAIERRCQWEGCEQEAAKHLIYLPERGQITEHDDGGTTLVLSMVHVDLCAEHLPLAGGRFGGGVIGLDEQCTLDGSVAKIAFQLLYAPHVFSN